MVSINSNISCGPLLSHFSEFKIYNNCIVDTFIDNIFRLLTFSVAILIFLIQGILLINQRKELQNKNIIANVILITSTIQNLIMCIRPLVGYITELRTINSIIVAFITNVSVSGAVTITIIFIYFESNILYNSSKLFKKRKEFCLIQYRKAILSTIAIIQVLVFIGGTILSRIFLNIEQISNYGTILFWIPLSIINFTVIPYFCILALILRKRILNNKSKIKYSKLANRLLLMVIICGITAIFTGTIGIIISIGLISFDWMFVEWCWIADIIFNFTIFIIIIRKKTTLKKNSNNIQPLNENTTGGITI